MNETKRIIVNQIKSKIVNRIGSSEACRIADAPLSALAYACTFNYPRRFSDIDMSPQDWSELADTLTVAELLNVQDSLVRFRPGNNKLFYMLGCFARVYARRTTGKPNNRITDHKERRYSRAELQAIVRNAGTFKETDL